MFRQALRFCAGMISATAQLYHHQGVSDTLLMLGASSCYQWFPWTHPSGSQDGKPAKSAGTEMPRTPSSSSTSAICPPEKSWCRSAENQRISSGSVTKATR